MFLIKLKISYNTSVSLRKKKQDKYITNTFMFSKRACDLYNRETILVHNQVMGSE